MKVGDLVRFDHEGVAQTNPDRILIGLIIEDTQRCTAHSKLWPVSYKEVYWPTENRVSPINPKHLKVVNGNRRLG
jgi:hypothetical protein